MKKIVINTVIAKKRGGGGFQVGKNFILRSLQDDSGETGVEWYYFVSEDMDEAIGDKCKSIRDIRYFTVPTQPSPKTYLATRKRLRELERQIKPDLVFSIIAPSYFQFQCPEIMEHDNAWDTNATKLAFDTLTFKQALRFRLKGMLIRRLLQRACGFITQSETVKQGLIRTTGNKNVEVVPNVLPMVMQKAPATGLPHEGINIVYVATGAPHKYVEIIPETARLLIDKYGVSDFHFVLTLPFGSEAERKIMAMAEEKKVAEHIINKGYQTQEELIDLYQHCDIGFFPSVLETFSATLLEYMKFQLPIVATDLPFNSEVAQKAALYFKPKDAKDAAEKINTVIRNEAVRGEMLREAEERMKIYGEYESNFIKKRSFLIKLIDN